jgi:hypothetical protein
MAVVDEDNWPPEATMKPQFPNLNERIPNLYQIANGKYDVRDAILPIYDEMNKK